MAVGRVHNAAAALLVLLLATACSAAADVHESLEAATRAHENLAQSSSWQSARRYMLAASPQVRTGSIAVWNAAHRREARSGGPQIKSSRAISDRLTSNISSQAAASVVAGW